MLKIRGRASRRQKRHRICFLHRYWVCTRTESINTLQMAGARSISTTPDSIAGKSLGKGIICNE
jgi:hypothetical protein